MKNKILGVIVCVALLTAVIPPTAAPAAQASREVRLGTIQPLNDLDPQLAQNSTEALLVEQVFLGLTGLDENGNPIPELAQVWEVSEDSRIWTFSLRPEVQWVGADRRPVRNVVARDVGFSLERAREFGNFNGLIEAVELVDDLTVMIILGQSYPELASLLAVAPAAKIVPLDLVLEAGDGWTLPGVIWGNGPYLLADRAGPSVTLEANPFWEGGRTNEVGAARVEYVEDPRESLRRFVNGEFDLIELYPDFRETVGQDPGFERLVRDVPGAQLNLFSQSPFARQVGSGHSYLVKEYLLPVYSSHFGLGGLHLWSFNNQLPEVQIADNVRVLNGETLGALLSLDEQGTLIFERQTPQLSLIQPGDILVGDSTLTVGNEAAPYGFLLRAVNLFPDGGRFLVETVPAFLDEAVIQGSLEQPVEIDLDNIYDIPPVSGLPQNDRFALAAYRPPYASLQIEIDRVLYDEDGDETNTTDDQVRVEGKVTVEPGAGMQFTLNIRNNQLQSMRFTNNLKQSAELKMYSQVKLADLQKTVTIKRFIFAPQTFLVGWVPVVITPEISVVAGINGSISVDISTGIKQTSTITAGAEYRDGNWNRVIEVGDLHVSPLEMTLKQSASARAFAGPELAVTIYGVAGPYGRIQAYLTLKVDPATSPWWTVKGGISGEVGFKAQVLSVIDLRFKQPFDIYGPETLGEAGKIIPTATFMPTKPPPSTPPKITNVCISILWPLRCWPWWLWVIAVLLTLFILGKIFG